MSGRRRTHHFVAAHPAGSRVTVFYDPDDPDRAVLVPGVDGRELFLGLFMLPFNIVMLALAGGFGTFFCRGTKALRHFWYGGRIIDRGHEVRVRLPRVSPVLMGLTTLMMGSVLALFPIAFCAGMSPPVGVMVAAWMVVLGSAAVVYFLLLVPIVSGKTDLVIDYRQGALTLPQTFGRGEAIVLPLSAILAIEVVAERKKSDEGEARAYVPTVRWQDAVNGLQQGRLAEWDDEQEAQELAAWIGAKVGLVPRSG
jgi:hypothetical protein